LLLRAWRAKSGTRRSCDEGDPKISLEIPGFSWGAEGDDE